MHGDHVGCQNYFALQLAGFGGTEVGQHWLGGRLGAVPSVEAPGLLTTHSGSSFRGATGVLDQRDRCQETGPSVLFPVVRSVCVGSK